MSTEQHESLKAADWIEELLPAIGGKEVAEKIRTQHALIVQMAEALTEQSAWLRQFASIRSVTVDAQSDEAIAAATQYLNPKGQE